MDLWLSILCVLFILCVIYLLKAKQFYKKTSSKYVRSSTMLVAGSGGHTTEILRLLSGMSDLYTPRYYIIAKTDKMSEIKIETFEKERESQQPYTIERIPRSREVAQSWHSSFVSTVVSCAFCFPIVLKTKPDLLLVNGPGTCVPVCLAALFLKLCLVKNTTIVFVESFCRVETMSLTGRLLYHLVDEVVVQWPELLEKYPKARYLGRIV